MKGSFVGRGLIVITLSGLLAVSAALNIAQRRAIVDLARSRDDPSTGRLNEGAILPPLLAKDLRGNDVRLDPRNDNGSTVFYVFQPSCIWCARNLEAINHLASRRDSRFKVIGISPGARGEVNTYLMAHQMAFPVFVEISTKSAKTYKLGPTPQTIVVDNNGKLLKVWSGAFSGSTKAEIELFFHLELPDLNWSATT